jgi:adenylate cyclase
MPALAPKTGGREHSVKALLLRLAPSIRYGTERYPESVARRLTALNIATWIVAGHLGFYTLVRLLDSVPGRLPVAMATAVFAVIFAVIPLLHRLGPWIATHVFVLLFFAYIWRVVELVGTAGGAYFNYFIVSGLAIVVYGIERIAPAILVTVAAVASILAQQWLLPADTGFLPPAVLLNVNYVTNVTIAAAALFGIVYYAMHRAARAEAAAEYERARSESLLANILPVDIVTRLKDSPQAEIADAFSSASILFADMADYTGRAGNLRPTELVAFLNAVYRRLDGIVERHGLEKIKTTGDSYMAVSGVPIARGDHAAALALFALEIMEALSGLVDPVGRPVPIRIGMASGPVVAGVIGTRKFSYDVWGDTVNIASRMESTGEPGKIQVAPSMYELLKDQFEFVARDPIEVRGKGSMRTWFLTGRVKANSSVATSAVQVRGVLSAKYHPPH